MISKEFLQKFEMNNEALMREIRSIKRLRKRRKLHVPSLNSSDTECSEHIGDFTKRSVAKGKKKKSKVKKVTVGATSKCTDDALILNTAKFAITKKKPQKLVSKSKLVQVNTFKCLHPQVTKSIQNKGTNTPTSNTPTHTPIQRTQTPPRKLKQSLDKQKGQLVSSKRKEASPTVPPRSKPVPADPQKEQTDDDVALIAPKNIQWAQYCRKAENALWVLNNEVSSALRKGMCSIDSIQMRVRTTMDEIKECEKVYNQLRYRQQCISIPSRSTPDLPDVIEIDQPRDDKLLRALDLGLIQTQSENQIRIAVLPSIAESIYEGDIDNDDCKEHELSKSIYDIPPQLPIAVEEPKTSSRKAETGKKLLKALKSLQESDAAALTLTEQDELHRRMGQSDLHKKLVREFEATERQMKPKGDTGRPRVVQIIAEELYIPEKINRIAPTLKGNDRTKKSRQFLYHQKMKREEKKKSSTSAVSGQKYPDSVLFANNEVKKTREAFVLKSGSDQCDVVIENKAQLKEFRTLHSTSCVNGLDCYDILDEIRLNDLKPLESEYPRRDNATSTFSRKVENTYIYKLVYGPMQEQFLKLLRFQEPRLACSHLTCGKCSSKTSHPDGDRTKPDKKQPPKILPRKKISSDISLPQKFTAAKQTKKKKNPHDDIVSRLKPYMFDPNTRYPTTITVMPVMVTTYTNPNFVTKTISKAHAEKNVGDFALKQLPKQKLKPPNVDKRKPCITRRNACSLAPPQKPHCDSGGDFETHLEIPKQTIIKRRTFRSTLESPTEPKRRPQAPETRKLQTNRKWEANIQSVIEMIETKIVEILSDPAKTHLEAFKAVETRILEILQSETSLEVIAEAPKEHLEKITVRKQRKFISKTTSNLKTKLNFKQQSFASKTDPRLHDIGNNAMTPIIVEKKSEMSQTSRLPSPVPVGDSTAIETVTKQELGHTSSEILEFLDTVTSISTVSLKRVVGYKRNVQLMHAFCASTVYYPITIMTSVSRRVTDRIKTQAIAPVASSSSRAKSISGIPTSRTYKILTGSVSHKQIKGVTIPKVAPAPLKEDGNPKDTDTPDVTIEYRLVEACSYGMLLNYVYTALFTIVFLALTFNYSCQ